MTLNTKLLLLIMLMIGFVFGWIFSGILNATPKDKNKSTSLNITSNTSLSSLFHQLSYANKDFDIGFYYNNNTYLGLCVLVYRGYSATFYYYDKRGIKLLGSCGVYAGPGGSGYKGSCDELAIRNNLTTLFHGLTAPKYPCILFRDFFAYKDSPCLVLSKCRI